MNEYKIEFDVIFNGKKAKTYRFNVKANNETEAFEKAEDIIKSKTKHKIVSINNEGVVPEKPDLDMDQFNKLFDSMDDPTSMTDEQVDDLIDVIGTLGDFLRAMKKLKNYK